MNTPRMVPFNNNFFEQRFLYVSFHSGKGLHNLYLDENWHITLFAYDSREKIPFYGQLRIKQKKTLSLQQRQELLAKGKNFAFILTLTTLTKDQAKLIKISQKKYEIRKKMEDLVQYPSQMDQFKSMVKGIKNNKKKNLSGVIESKHYNTPLLQPWLETRII